MSPTERAFRRFRRFRIWQQSLLVVAAAVLCTELLTLAFYALYFSDRLVLDVLFSALITVMIATPFSMVFLTQTAKVEHLVEELRLASLTDHLTRLANRREFMSTVRPYLNSAATPQSEGVLLFIDADHFKSVNDTYGHAAGDSVLVNLAEIIDSSVRKGDIAARVGGEEFAVFLPRAEVPLATIVAERIRLQARELGSELGLAADAVSVSIGIARHKPGQDLVGLLQVADRALYIAKNGGRDRVVCDEVLSSAA